MNRLLTLLGALLFTVAASAQGTLQGKLTDTTGKNGLALATVTVFHAVDTALITYRLSNADGVFRVPNLPLRTPLRVVISYSGYDAWRREFRFDSSSTLDLGTVELQTTSGTLDEVLVVAERPPVTVRKDTIEFNASSFKTLPTSLVEDLLRKLPGVQVDRDGNITANGRRVNRILVDGKSFFGDDPKMATRNLPANVIDKVQVAEDGDERARNTDGNTADIGQVINLTLKKGVKKGWFGKVYAGAGTEGRYEAGGIANIYRDTLQLSVLAFSNNVNRSGFSMRDVQSLGGFDRSGTNSMMVMRNGAQEGFALNGISFGGLERGVSRTSGAGFNLNHAPSKKSNFFLQYFLGDTYNRLKELTNVQQFIGDTVIHTVTDMGSRRNIGSHNLNVGANLKPDSVTNITFRAGYKYDQNENDILSRVQARSSADGPLSEALNEYFNTAYGNELNVSLNATRRSRVKKDRSFNLSSYTYYRENLQRNITESDLRVEFPDPAIRFFEQLRRQDVPSLTSSLNLGWAEPLSKKFTFRWNNVAELLRDEQDISLFTKNGPNGKYDVPDRSRMDGFERQQYRLRSTASLTYKLKDFSIIPSVAVQYQDIDNTYRRAGTGVDFSLFDVLPGLSITRKQASLNYSENIQAPGVQFLIPIPDSTNPYFIRFGNPNLRPSHRRSLYFNNFSFFSESASTFNVFFNGTLVDDEVIMARTVTAQGVEIVRPVNADGAANFYFGAGYGKEFKQNPKFIFSFRFNPYINYDRRPIIVNDKQSTANTLNYGPSLSFSLNWSDIVEFRPEYRPSVSRTSYSDAVFRDISAINHNLESELIVRWPKRLVWESNVSYRNTNLITPGLPRTNVLWNAAATLLMLKDSKGLLKLTVWDLLNRNNVANRRTTQNQIIDSQINTLQRYATLTFTYNIRNMAAPKKVGGRDRLFMF